MMSTSKCPSDGAWTFDEACEKSPNARLEVRSRLSGQSGVMTADTTGAETSPPSEVEDGATPCSNLSQCSQEMMSTHTFAPSSLAPGANACQCSQVEWQLWWQSLAYEGACQKNLEQQQWLQQVEAQNNELTVLVEALRAEKRVLEQRLFRCDDELFEAKECLMAEFIQHRALQIELEREREICSGARCRNEKLQSMLLACIMLYLPNIYVMAVFEAPPHADTTCKQCRADSRYEDACQQRDQEAMQVELCRQHLQRAETRNDELTVLVSALEAAKERLEQRLSEAASSFQATSDQLSSEKRRCAELESEKCQAQAVKFKQVSKACQTSDQESVTSGNEDSEHQCPANPVQNGEEWPPPVQPLVKRADIENDEPSVLDGSRDTNPIDTACLVLPCLLQHLSVSDILSWRQTSRQTRCPSVLILHVTEMGRMDRSDQVIDFSVKFQARTSGTSLAEICHHDVEQQKSFECRFWCMRLATTGATHFAESDARNIVVTNLQSLFGHCFNVEERWLKNCAHHIVANYGVACLPFVRQLIAQAMLGRMGDVLLETSQVSREAALEALHCTQHLENVVRSLTRPQRQKWVSLLVRVLHTQALPERVIGDLKLLWRADDDPSRTYAEAEKELRSMLRWVSRDLRRNLLDLLCCC